MNINTISIAPVHYTRGFFTIGSGAESVLIIGSCRSVPYANYFHYLNADNRFTIHLIDVVKYYYDENGNPRPTEVSAQLFENSPEMLNMIKGVKWFIHEHCESFGMLNTSKSCPKNIFQFGMNPEIDMGIPNFNDIWIMFQELANLSPHHRRIFMDDIAQNGKITYKTVDEVRAEGLEKMEKFLRHCEASSIPEFATRFRDRWRDHRYFWTGNHVSSLFTTEVFSMLNDRYLHLYTTPEFWSRILSEDAYRIPSTPVTPYDVEAFNLTWQDPVTPLSL